MFYYREAIPVFTKEPIRPNFKCNTKARLSWPLLNIKTTIPVEHRLGHFLTLLRTDL